MMIRRHSSDVAEVRDTPALVISIFVKVVRVLFLWIIFYFVDRAYQAMYVENVLGKDVDAIAAMDLRPRLWTMMPLVLAIEAVVLVAVLLILLALKKKFDEPGNTFVIDASLIRRIVKEYLLSVLVIMPIGIAFGYVMQHCKELRYRDDGLRGIRAQAILLFIMSAIVIFTFVPI